MWVWLLFVFIPPLALGFIGIRDAGWAIGRWPKNYHPESQVSKVTGDCNALFKKNPHEVFKSNFRGLKGYLSRSLLASKEGLRKIRAPKNLFHTLGPHRTIPHPIFSFHGCFENPSHRHFPLRKWSCYNRSWPKRLWILPIFGTFGMVGDGGSRESGFNSRVVLSYPGNGG